MITLDQVLLLQKKVETAVSKIAELNSTVEQLNKENDALRSKCAELTKAFSEKSEQISTLQDEQGKIEEGILMALDRLSTVENSVLNTAGSSPLSNPANFSNNSSEPAVTEHNEPVQEQVNVENNSNPSDQTVAAGTEFQPDIF